MELELIKLAYQLTTTDWDLTEIEVDGEWISIYDIRDRFKWYLDNH